MKKFSIITLVIAIMFCFGSCSNIDISSGKNESNIELTDTPAYSGDAYVKINDNKPEFKKKEYTTKSFEKYSKLDSLGRCGVAYACIGKDLMPTEKRGYIGSVKPTGWQISKYDFVDGKYLYNRCHLIGYQLTGENANERNLITGTRYLNIEGMLPFENMVADYIKETNNHVLYRVTPVFKDTDLVADGVQMEGYSVEDKGEGISFNVYCYNVQPGVTIDYNDGSNALSGESVTSAVSSKTTYSKSSSSTYKSSAVKSSSGKTYILNTNNKKIHLPDCRFASSINSKNKKVYTGNVQDLLDQGYTFCQACS